MKYFLLLIISFLTFSFVHSQTAVDALRYSQLNVSGSARFIGVGGSMSALGTDYSTLSTNPAGLAAYRKSEFVITTSFSHINSEARLLGNGNGAVSDTKNRFNLNNLGLVFFRNPRSRKWKSLNFGVGYNRTNDFNYDTEYEGQLGGSIAYSFAEAADNFFPDELTGSSLLAFNTGAIYGPDQDLIYLTDFDNNLETPVYRNERIRSTGGMNEMVFSLAANYDHKLMIGATIGVPFIDWEQNRTYSEEDQNNEIPSFRNLIYQESVTTSGIGINAKLGVIYRINQAVRVGGAVHTPSRFSLTDNFSESLIYDFEDGSSGGVFSDETAPGSFNYRLRTPWRYMLNGAVLIKKMGFISAELEYIDYSNSSYNYERDNNGIDPFFEEAVNNDIENDFQSALNIRLGAEYALKVFRFRAGYIINGSAFADNTDNNNILSLGFGMRVKSFYFDVAYRLSGQEGTYEPYTTNFATQPVVNTNLTSNQGMLTLGFRF